MHSPIRNIAYLQKINIGSQGNSEWWLTKFESFTNLPLNPRNQ